MPKRKTIAKDVALSEITLRRYEKPSELGKRELLRKLCLSIGLLQPGDSRDVIIDVLQALLNAKSKKELLNSEDVREEVIKLRKKARLPLKGIAGSNVRRQLKRLREILIVEKLKNDYRISEFEELITIFNERIEKFYLQGILSRVKEYFNAIK